MKNERRRPEALKLRIYFDAIARVESMSNDQWISEWIAHGDSNAPFLLKTIWLEQLKAWALEEAAMLSTKAA